MQREQNRTSRLRGVLMQWTLSYLVTGTLMVATLMTGCAASPHRELRDMTKAHNVPGAKRVIQKYPEKLNYNLAVLYGAQYCSPEVASMGLNNGGNLNSNLNYGDKSKSTSALSYAVYDGCLSVAELLVSRGADINFAGKGIRHTVLDLALIHQKSAMINFLQSRRAQKTLSNAEIAAEQRLIQERKEEDEVEEAEYQSQRQARKAQSEQMLEQMLIQQNSQSYQPQYRVQTPAQRPKTSSSSRASSASGQCHKASSCCYGNVCDVKCRYGEQVCY